MSPALTDVSLNLAVWRIEDQQYALPVTVVERVLPMVAVSPLPHAPSMALGVINLHGTVIPVLDLRRRFGFTVRDYGLNAHLLIARTLRRTLALAVDEVLGVRQVAVASVTAPAAVLPGLSHIAGIVTLDDGLLFIHDLDTCLSLDEEQQLTMALEGMAP